MDAGTRESELARTRALLHVTTAYLKRTKGNPELRQMALIRIDALLEQYLRLIEAQDTPVQ